MPSTPGRAGRARAAARIPRRRRVRAARAARRRSGAARAGRAPAGRSGVGEAIARAFDAAGARVAGISLDGGAPVDGIFVSGDTGDASAVDDLARRAVDAWGGIDVWVNDAARLMVKPIAETSDEDWHGLLRGNLHGYFYGGRAAVRQLLSQ